MKKTKKQKTKKQRQFSLNEKEVNALLCALQISDLRQLNNEDLLICEELRDLFNRWLD